MKLPLYARAGVAELWIVDMKRRVVDAYRKPARGEYTETSTHQAGERIALMLAPDIIVGLNLVLN